MQPATPKSDSLLGPRSEDLRTTRAPPPGDGRGLSPRLAEILLHVLRGAPNKVIARDLGLSEHTAKEYISSILAFHGVRNRLELLLKLQGAPDDPLNAMSSPP